MLALVTGASSGIGYELAIELAKRGYDLVAVSAGERLGPAADTFKSYGHHVTEAAVDLSTPEGVEDLWRQVERVGAPVEVACLNAGIGLGGLFWETDLKTELNMVSLNCSSTVQLAKYVVRQMVDRGAGEDSVHVFDRRGNGGAARSRLRRQQGIRSFLRAQPSLRAERQGSERDRAATRPYRYRLLPSRGYGRYEGGQ